jgi:hypothetical protein
MPGPAWPSRLRLIHKHELIAIEYDPAGIAKAVLRGGVTHNTLFHGVRRPAECKSEGNVNLAGQVTA